MKNIIWSIFFVCVAIDLLRRALYDKEIDKKEVISQQPEELNNINILHPEIDPETKHNSEIKNKENKISNTSDPEDSDNLVQKKETSRFETEDKSEKAMLTVKYCTASLSKQFEDFKKDLLAQKYDSIQIEGSEYPINQTRKLLSKGLFFVQMAVMVILIGGQTIRNYLTFIPERVLTFIEEKKFMVGIFNFFVMGQLSTMLNSTGAFEVSLNGDLIWSNLDMKLLPKASDIISIILNKGFNLE